jgi:hypothetical protein
MGVSKPCIISIYFVYYARHWVDIENQKAFFNQVAKEMRVNKPEDWQKVTVTDIKERGGTGLLARYDGSLAKGKLFIF